MPSTSKAYTELNFANSDKIQWKDNLDGVMLVKGERSKYKKNLKGTGKKYFELYREIRKSAKRQFEKLTSI